MKILIIRPYASVVNSNLYNLQHIGLAKAFIRIGHSCDIIYWSGNTCEKKEQIEYRGKLINIFWMNGRKIGKDILYDSRRIEKIIADYDIVQVEEYEQLFSCRLAIRHPEKVVVYHGPYKSDYKKLYSLKSKAYDLMFRKKLIRNNVQFITKTEAAYKTLQEKGISRIVVSPVGLDIEKFGDFDFRPEDIGQSLKLLYIGELCDRRSIDFLIEVLSEIRTKGMECTLTLIGKGEEQYVNECKSLVNEKNLANYVAFLGPQSQEKLPEVYRNHDIFLLASKYEIFGMILLESMLFGCLMISSSNAGSEMVITNGKNGFVEPDFDINKWTNTIVDILNNKYDVKSILNAAHDEVLTKYTWDYSAKIFVETYELLLKKTN